VRSLVPSERVRFPFQSDIQEGELTALIVAGLYARRHVLQDFPRIRMHPEINCQVEVVGLELSGEFLKVALVSSRRPSSERA